MKPILAPITALILLSACGGDSGAETSDSGAADAALSATAADPAAAVTTSPKLPWDIPIIPGARYISGSTEFSPTTEKRGGEAIATIAVTGSVMDIISYYEKVLPEHDFTITKNQNYDESTAVLVGESADGREFRVSAMRGGSKARDGESTAAIIATKAKLAPGS